MRDASEQFDARNDWVVPGPTPTRAPGKSTLTSRLAPRRLERLTREDDDEGAKDTSEAAPLAAATAQGAANDPFGMHLLGAPTASANSDDDRELARKFAEEFRYVLATFTAVTSLAALDKLSGDDRKAKLDVGATWLKQQLTAWQRARLVEFMATHVIPEGLFIASGADGCGLSQPHRILIAGHVLEKGVKADPGDSKDKRVHAANCGHWVEYVWIYAGVQSAKKDSNAGEGTTWGVRGPTGTVSFGGGGDDRMQASGASAFASDAAAGRTCEANTLRKAPIGWPDDGAMWKALTDIVAGDWLYIDNGGAAMHSVLFVEWQSGPTRSGTQAEGVARILHQGTPAAGGTESTTKLGYPNRTGVNPVTMIARPAKDAGPPRDEAALLHYTRSTAIKATEAHVANYGLDLDKLHAALAVSVDDGLTRLATLEPTQRKLCESIRADASAEVSIENVVRLVALAQRVHPIYVQMGNGRSIDGVFNPAGQDKDLVKGGIATIRRQAGWKPLK